MNSPLPWPGRRERRTAGAAGAVASPKAHPTALGHAALAGDGGGAGRGVDADADPDRVLCVNELPHDHHIPLKTHMNPDENQLYKQFLHAMFSQLALPYATSTKQTAYIKADDKMVHNIARCFAMADRVDVEFWPNAREVTSSKVQGCRPWRSARASPSRKTITYAIYHHTDWPVGKRRTPTQPSWRPWSIHQVWIRSSRRHVETEHEGAQGLVLWRQPGHEHLPGQLMPYVGRASGQQKGEWESARNYLMRMKQQLAGGGLAYWVG